MSKLYIFGIGGTGSRVMRSLAMLMASGVDMGKTDEVVPVFIDPDKSNGDLTRTIEILNKYDKIHQSLHFTEKREKAFFRIGLNCVVDNFTFQLAGTDDRNFRKFIGLDSMPSRANQAFAHLLFSKKNLKARMDVGFKGNPNIGSVVLNQLVLSDSLKEITNNFEEGDRIFIISSIFGGTGASGFPLLVKTFRTNQKLPKHALLNNAPIGAVSILPYFNLQNDEESEIDSSTFITKTKSALAYYEHNMSGEKGANSLYFLADQPQNTYENHEGKTEQCNDAHLIELLAATAIVHFSKSDILATENKFFEMGLNCTSQGAVDFHSLPDQLADDIQKPLTQLLLVANNLAFDFEGLKEVNWGKAQGFDNDWYHTDFIRFLREYMGHYWRWLEEMKQNRRSLDFFNLHAKGKPFDMVTGIKEKKWNKHPLWVRDYELIRAALNNAAQKGHWHTNEKPDIFLEWLYRTTQMLVEKKFAF